MGVGQERRRLFKVCCATFNEECQRSLPSINVDHVASVNYTAAQLAELVGVERARVRAWQQRGWIVPAEMRHRLAYFDFTELAAARNLAALHKAGVKPATIAHKLIE